LHNEIREVVSVVHSFTSEREKKSRGQYFLYDNVHTDMKQIPKKKK